MMKDKISVQFLVILLIKIHSTCCQKLVLGKGNVCIRDENNETLHLHKNDVEKEKMKRTLANLQRKYEILEEESNALGKKLDDAVRNCQRNVESLRIRIETARYIPPVPDNKVNTSSADYIGGTGGRAFDDYSAWKGKHISALQLRCSDAYVVSLKIKYGNLWAREHGGCTSWLKNSQTKTYNFDTSEYITTIEATTGGLFGLRSMVIHTNKRVLPRCGPHSGIKKTASGRKLLYISGRSGCVLDGLLPHWL